MKDICAVLSCKLYLHYLFQMIPFIYIVFLGICKTVPLNTRWLGYACYIWCITQYCKNRGTYRWWKAEDTLGPQKGGLPFGIM